MVRTLLASLSLCALSTAIPLASRQAIQCVSGFYMIVARGSTEAQGEGPLSQVSSLIEGMVPDSTSVAVVYPATIFGSGTYPNSVIDGINNATQMVTDYVDTCGDSSRIVLLGYSQGGNVMTDMLAGGVDKPAPLSSDYSQYISGVAVFGDPTFTLGQSFDAGTATGSGIFSRGGDSLALLNQYADIIQSYCLDNDIVCGDGDSVSVHESEVQTNAQAAANFIASLA